MSFSRDSDFPPYTPPFDHRSIIERVSRKYARPDLVLSEEDLAQDIWEAAIDEDDQLRPALSNADNPPALYWTFAERRAKDRIKKERLKSTSTDPSALDALGSGPERAPTAEDFASSREALDRVRRKVGEKLGQRHVRVVDDKLHEVPVATTAKDLGVTKQRVSQMRGEAEDVIVRDEDDEDPNERRR